VHAVSGRHDRCDEEWCEKAQSSSGGQFFKDARRPVEATGPRSVVLAADLFLKPRSRVHP